MLNDRKIFLTKNGAIGEWGRPIHVSTSLVHANKLNESANLTAKAALHGFSRMLAVELAAGYFITWAYLD